MKPVFTINDWDTLFENCSSRKLRNLNWVPIPNGHDSVEYSRLMNRKDGPEIFAAWILLIQVASKCVERGVLKSSNGRPYDAEELAVKTRAPEKIFVKALPYLCSSGWIISGGLATFVMDWLPAYIGGLCRCIGGHREIQAMR